MQNRSGAQAQFDGVKETDFLPLFCKQVTLKKASISPVKEVALSKHRISKEKIPMNRSFIISALAVLAVMLVQACSISASPFYQYQVVAAAGQIGITGIGKYVSINDSGNVAFVGKLAGGEAIFIGGSVPLRNITPGFVASDRFFGDTVQINDVNYIASQMKVLATPAKTFIHVWNGNTADSSIEIAAGGIAPNDDYSAVFSQPTISNTNNYSDVVFSAFKADTNIKLLSKLKNALNHPASNRHPDAFIELQSTPQIPVEIPVHPMIADNGRIVFRAGNQRTSPIVLCNNLTPPCETIASTDIGFTDLGASPGVSDDGQIVEFYGHLSAAGTVTLGITGGDGIYTSIQDKGFGSRRIIKIAGLPAELGSDKNGNPLSFSSFDQNSRVAVTHLAMDDPVANGTFVVSFIATPNAAKPDFFSAQRGIWTARVDAMRSTGDGLLVFNTSSVVQVAQVGDVIEGHTITDLAVFDQIGNAQKDDNGDDRSQHPGDHRIAFWASTDKGDIVVRASHLNDEPLIFIAGAGASYLYDTDQTINVWPGFPGVQDLLTLDPAVPHDHIIATDVMRYVPFKDSPKKIIQYGPLLETLTTRGGYVEYDVGKKPERRTSAGCDYSNQKDKHPTLFVMAYDWRLSVSDLADTLKDYIGCVQKFHPGKKINIITHSMGSLIARRYILKNPKDHMVDKLITFGAPWLGAPKGLYVLETGDFGLPSFLVSQETIKRVAEFSPGIGALMPGQAYFDLAGSPLYFVNSYNQFIDWLNQRFPRGRPGEAVRTLRDYPGQEDWRNDQSGVQYYHIYGQQAIARTIGKVFIKNVCRLDPQLKSHCDEMIGTKWIQGDGTVPLVSAERIGNGQDLNAPRAHRFLFASRDSKTDDFVEHTSLTHLAGAEQLVLDILGPTPPQDTFLKYDVFASVLMSISPAYQGDLQVGANDTPSPPGEPAYYLTVTGAGNVTITDAAGNSTAPINDAIAGEVPDVTYYFVGKHSYSAIMPVNQTYTITFRSGSEPIALELTQGDGVTTTQAIRYQDLMLPTGVNAMLQITPGCVK